jgi:iron(III) transport system substrate-binding protein
LSIEEIPMKAILPGSLTTSVSMIIALAMGGSACAQQSWMVPDLLAAAKKEGTMTLYTSINEEEALPILKVFEDATGIKIELVRNSDTGLLSRIMVEQRAGRQSWDVIQTTAVSKMPQELLAKYEPPEAKDIQAGGRDPGGKWWGVYANYNTPAYNTNKVKKEDLPKSFEELSQKKEWAGKVGLDVGDASWLSGIYRFYGEQKGEQLAKAFFENLKPRMSNGHLALARSVGAGEFDVAITNYLNLTLNVKLSGAPTDFWVLDPVVVFYGQAGVNEKAPHPNAARLFTNFMLSREGQTALTARGRIPTRSDVETNPPGILKALEGKKIEPVLLSPADEQKWARTFKQVFDIR